MTIDAIAPSALGLAQVATAASLPSSGSSELPAPTDPFEILLAAASESSDTSASSLASTPAPTATPGEQELVTLASTPTSSTSTPDSGAAIVSMASRYLGVPYLWGGSTPSGFDCSGLTQYVFSQLGVSLPRTAAEQEQVGVPVADLAAAQPGDLLFFEPGQNGAPPGEAGHVAIYLGDNEMIAAPETGENVQVQTVPGEPLAIRRVNVPTENDDSPEAPQLDAGSPSVEMGSVTVPGQYAGLIESAAATSGTPPSLLAAILSNESGFNPEALSSSGAEGIAQFMPTTAAANGIDPFDPASAITGAANLLASYHAAFGSWSDAVAAYASGGSAVESAGGVPNDGETQSYVASALALAGMAPSS